MDRRSINAGGSKLSHAERRTCADAGASGIIPIKTVDSPKLMQAIPAGDPMTQRVGS
jgi:hypothetical protein